MKERDHAEFMHFASTQVPTVLHVATLLTGSKSLAEDVTIESLRRVASHGAVNDERARLRCLYGALLRGWRHRRRSSREQTRGPLELQDLRPESSTATTSAPTADNIIRDGLRALTDGERVVLVLQIVAGLDLDDVRRVVRRPTRLVRRDLDTSLSFLADASGMRLEDIEDRARRALQMRQRGQADGAALYSKLQTLLEADSSRRRLARPKLVAAAALTTAAVVVAAYVVGQSGDHQEAADQRASDPPATSLELPGTPSGLKLVGFKRIMVTVPDSWQQSTPLCINVYGNSVLYPMDDELPPCVEATVPGNSVAFGRYDSIDGSVAFKRGHQQLAGERLLVSDVIHGDGEFLQYAALRGANVAVSVRATKRSDLAMILSSVQEVPASYVVVPNCVKLDPEQASELLADNALNGRIFADSSTAGSTIAMRVVTQSPDVGTLLPFEATVNLGVLPR